MSLPPAERFDPYASEVTAAGPAVYADLAVSCPLFHYTGRFDFFVVSDRDEVTGGILADSPVWSVENGTTPKPLPPAMRIALNSDGTRATKVRYVVQRGFAPAELRRLAGVVDSLADELIGAMEQLPERRGNFYDLLAKPLPARLNCIMMGLPQESWRDVKAWADRYFHAALNEPDARLSSEDGRVFSDPVFSLIAERRALLAGAGEAPNLAHVGTLLPNDFLSRFMCDSVEGEPLGDDEIHSLMVGIILGGNETTMMLMTNLAKRLLEVPERWQALRRDPSLIEVAMEECLRLDPPIYGMFRSAVRDVPVKGGIVPKGAKVLYNIPAANRDPHLWPEPDKFRMDRRLQDVKRHVSFARGRHGCLGAPLARMEVRRVFEALVARLPQLRLEAGGRCERAPGFSIFGWTELPLRWD